MTVYFCLSGLEEKRQTPSLSGEAEGFRMATGRRTQSKRVKRWRGKVLRAIASLLLIFCASQASAQNCPDFFRFVDFGLEGRDGAISRGGPIFRAESLSGQPLLLRDRTECLGVREVSVDGRGNPIPVVTSIQYSPEKTNIDLTELRVAVVDDTETAAEKNARIHRAGLKQSDTEITRGANFFCASFKESLEMSCQLESPYPGNIALVVYCDALQCTMPVLAIDEQILVSAVWASGGSFLSDPATAGPDIFDKIQRIHDFLGPLSSAL